MSLLLTTLCALAPQQEAPTSGRVLDAAGAPVADAGLVFLSRPIPRSLDAGPEDRRVTRTDADGRFRIALRKDAGYTLWASWRDGATPVHEGITGGEFVELRGARGAGPVALRLEGADAWAELGPLSLRAVVGGENFDFAPLTRSGDEWRVPPLPPFENRTTEVLDGRGEVVWSFQAQALKGPQPTVSLPPLATRTVIVRDAAGEPVAGATVRRHILNYWYCESATLAYGERFHALWPIVGTTDAAGRCELRIPWPEHTRSLWLLTEKPGYRGSLDGIDDRKRFGAGQQAAEPVDDDGGPIEVALQAAEPTVLPLLGKDGPIAERWLFLACRVRVTRARGSKGTPLMLTLPVADGRATFASPLPENTDVEIAECMPSAPLAAALAERHGFAPPVLRVPNATSLLGPNGLPRWDPADTRVLQITTADGRPAAHVVALAGAGDERIAAVRTDRLGRALLPGKRALEVGALADGGFAVTAVPADGAEPVVLQLQATVALPIHVQDEQDQPLGGIVLRVREFQTADPRGPMIGALLLFRLTDASGADGNLTLGMPAVAGTVKLQANGRIAAGAEIDWDPAKPAQCSVTVVPRQ